MTYTAPSSEDDVVDCLLRIEKGSALDELRAGRPQVRQRTQSAYAALFDPLEPGRLTVDERFSVGAQVAEQSGSPLLAAHFRHRLSGVDRSSASRRHAALLAHADLVTRTPAQARPADLAALGDAGLTTAEIVTLSQVIAYVSYLARAVYGLSLLAGSPPAGASEPARAGFDKAFTTEVLDWKPWLDVIDPREATADQRQVLEESGPHAQKSAYYHLLLHDSPVLRERSLLFNAIMYGPRGLSRADRELGATAESILNGCVYCTSVHARFYTDLSKRPEVIAALFTAGLSAELDPRQSAIVGYSAALAATPPSAGLPEVDALRAAGLSDTEIFDLTNSVAIFAWANRLMLTLGEPVRPNGA